MRENKFDGVWTAIVTPFDDIGEIDWAAFDALVEMQVAARVTGLVVSGTTGESPTLTVQEKLSIIRRVKAKYSDKLYVMAGTGGNNTQQSVELSRLASDSGADAMLVVTPPYNKPNMTGMIAHYREIANAQEKPICLYHVPGRTAQSLNPSQIAEICSVKNVSMVKEASGDIALFSRALNLSKATFFTGDDPTFLASMSVGGHGVISVFSNIFPKSAVNLYNAFQTGNIELAKNINNALLPFIDAMFIETNPCPAKACLAHMGIIKNNFRLPLATVSKASYEKIIEIYSSTKDRLSSLNME